MTRENERTRGGWKPALQKLAEEAEEFADQVGDEGPKSGEETDDDGCSFSSYTIRNFLAGLANLMLGAEAAGACGAATPLSCGTEVEAHALNG